MNVLITGTSSGIGKGCAKYFLKNGHKVYGFDRKESTIEHPDYKHYCLDIRDKEMYPELPPMQIVINNAGVQNEDDIDILEICFQVFHVCLHQLGLTRTTNTCDDLDVRRTI